MIRPSEGDRCLECDKGTLEFTPDGDCSYHINPPCGACVDAYLACNDCGAVQANAE